MNILFLFPQEWEEKAAKDKKRYEAEMEKWKAEGGLEQLKAAKKAAKKEGKGKAKAAASGPPASGIKSKEFIESSDSGKKRMGICSTGV